MKRLVPLLLALPIAACSPSGEPGPAPSASAMIEESPIPLQGEGGAWQAAGSGAVYALPGGQRLFALSCIQPGAGAARLQFSRFTRAPEGATALMAVEGNGLIARLKVDVVKAGDPGEWRGTHDAYDKQLGAFSGGGSPLVTLPGGGSLRLRASDLPGRILSECRGGRGARSDAPDQTPEDEREEGVR